MNNEINPQIINSEVISDGICGPEVCRAFEYNPEHINSERNGFRLDNDPMGPLKKVESVYLIPVINLLLGSRADTYELAKLEEESKVKPYHPYIDLDFSFLEFLSGTKMRCITKLLNPQQIDEIELVSDLKLEKGKPFEVASRFYGWKTTPPFVAGFFVPGSSKAIVENYLLNHGGEPIRRMLSSVEMKIEGVATCHASRSIESFSQLRGILAAENPMRAIYYLLQEREIAFKEHPPNIKRY